MIEKKFYRFTMNIIKMLVKIEVKIVTAIYY